MSGKRGIYNIICGALQVTLEGNRHKGWRAHLTLKFHINLQMNF